MKGNWYWVAFASVLGVFASTFPYSWVIGMIGCGILLTHRHSRKFFLCLMCLSFSFCSITPHFDPLSPPDPHEKSNVQATIISDPVETESYQSFLIQDVHTGEKWNATTFEPIKGSFIQMGGQCTVSGEVVRFPFARNPGEFNYERFMLQKGVSGSILIDPNTFACRGSKWYSSLFQKRQEWMRIVEQKYSDNTSAWVEALVFGVDKDMEESTIHLFQRWGLSHLLAISGLHVGLCMAIFSYLLLRFFGITKRLLSVLLLTFLPIYALLAGSAPSVIRAVGMAEAVLLLSLLKLKWPLSDIISVLFCGILIIQPTLVNQLGFQFSFLVTFGLIISKSWLSSSLHSFDLLVRVSLFCQLVVLPLQLQAFYSFNPLALLANLLFVPLISILVLPACLILFIAAFFIPQHLLGLLDWCFTQLMKKLIVILEILDLHVLFEWVTGQLWFGTSIVVVICFAFMMKAWEYDRKRKAFWWGVLLTVVMMLDGMFPYIHSPGRTTMLDIGQGDCLIIEWPNREHVMMIDAAGLLEDGEDPTYERIIEPYLRHRGITKVHSLILTHADQDHIGAAQEVINGFHVDNVMTSPFFKGELKLHHTEKVTVQAGDTLNVKGVNFHFLYPYRDSMEKNDNSLVFSAVFGGLTWMFTGDVSKEGEAQMVTDGLDLDVDVLKVAHHGSDTSTGEEWLTGTKPTWALISAGVDNRYGHPHDKVLERLEEAGVSVVRTDEKGAVIFEFSGGTGTFSSHLP